MRASSEALGAIIMKLDRSVLFCGSAIAAIAIASPAFAREQGSGAPVQASERVIEEGTITGVIATEAGGNILRNAVITVDAGDKHYSEVSGEDGSYTVRNVPAGPVTVTVSFVGYVEQTQEAVIAPGGTVRLDFNLAQSGRHGQAASENDIVVQGEREGQASSIQAQRHEMQIADVISTEAYGDVAGGNPAEMIKYMPGVDVDGTNGTAIYASLRGLPGEFTRTQLNGMDVISANANSPTGYANSAAAARVFSYESIGISAIDSIILYKTVGADQNADAPAGIVDLRTKHAYNRQKPVLLLAQRVHFRRHAGQVQAHRPEIRWMGLKALPAQRDPVLRRQLPRPSSGRDVLPGLQRPVSRL